MEVILSFLSVATGRAKQASSTNTCISYTAVPLVYMKLNIDASNCYTVHECNPIMAVWYKSKKPGYKMHPIDDRFDILLYNFA